jgi:hypothetical protein
MIDTDDDDGNNNNNNNNNKVHPKTGHESPEGEQSYISSTFVISALVGSGWFKSRSVRFTPGKDPVPIVQEAGWSSGPVWASGENLAPTGFGSPDCPAIGCRKFLKRQLFYRFLNQENF